MSTTAARISRTETTYLALIAATIGALGALGNLVFRTAIRLAAAGFAMVGDAWAALAPPLAGATAPVVLMCGAVALLALERLFPTHALGYGFPRFLESREAVAGEPALGIHGEGCPLASGPPGRCQGCAARASFSGVT